MLRDMRFRGFDFQMRQAGNELEQANKCESQESIRNVQQFQPLSFY